MYALASTRISDEGDVLFISFIRSTALPCRNCLQRRLTGGQFDDGLECARMASDTALNYSIQPALHDRQAWATPYCPSAFGPHSRRPVFASPETSPRLSLPRLRPMWPHPVAIPSGNRQPRRWRVARGALADGLKEPGAGVRFRSGSCGQSLCTSDAANTLVASVVPHCVIGGASDHTAASSTGTPTQGRNRKTPRRCRAGPTLRQTSPRSTGEARNRHNVQASPSSHAT